MVAWVVDWCVRCGEYLASEGDDWVCPVCRDEARLINERLYKELG